MRRLVCLLVLVGCGKQLNAEYCAQKANANDPDCIAAGFTRTDAPAPCSSDDMCAGNPGGPVCDLMKRECVACTPTDFAMCPTGTPKCGPDDQCHECVVDMDCPGGGKCLPSFTCVSSDSFLYTEPGASGDCSKAMPCTLRTAIGRLDPLHQVISVGTGMYAEGPLVIDKSGVLIGQGTNGDPTATSITNVSGQSGTVITVSGGQVSLDYVSVFGSPGDDGATCTGGALTFHASNSHDNGNYGLSSSGGCMLSIDRASIFKNYEAALNIDGGTIQIVNNFIYDNGHGAGGGAVRVDNGATGLFQYNSISFNQYKTSNAVGGFVCGSATADVEFNIISGQGKYAYSNGSCAMQFNYVINDPAPIRYASPKSPYDLHLTSATPTQTQDANTPIRDNSNTTCTTTGITLDIDGKTRPVGQFCDLGAHEFR